jgi:hypothetical protein
MENCWKRFFSIFAKKTNNLGWGTVGVALTRALLFAGI